MVESIAEIFVGDNDYPTNVFLDDLAMASSEIGWATGAGIWATKDGANWRRQFVGDRGLKGIASARDGKYAWAVGVDGTMVATVDGGDSWFHQLRRPGASQLTKVIFSRIR